MPENEAALRVALLLILLTAVSISGYYRARARRETGVVRRRDEGFVWVLLRLAYALPLLAGIVAWLVSPALLEWSRLPLPGWLRWLGVGLGALCLPLVWWVVRTLGPNISETVLTKPEHRLVVEGPYRRVRHPLYTTGLSLLVATSLITASAFLAVWTLLVAIGIRTFVIPREEVALVDRFGERYIEYRARTGALLPWPRPSAGP